MLYIVEESYFEGTLEIGDMIDQHINLLIGNSTFVSLMVIVSNPHKR